ncbi:MAG: hypothetical protein ABJA57_04925 [Ginsengibacter sp.]
MKNMLITACLVLFTSLYTFAQPKKQIRHHKHHKHIIKRSSHKKKVIDKKLETREKK